MLNIVLHIIYNKKFIQIATLFINLIQKFFKGVQNNFLVILYTFHKFGFSHFATKTNLLFMCLWHISMPKELNFFDTNLVVFSFVVFTLGILLEAYPSEIETFMFLRVSECYWATSTERKPFVVVAIAIIVVKSEHAGFWRIIPIGATSRERTKRIFSV